MIAQLNPMSLTIGAAITTITVTGTNFINGTVIQVAGSTRPITFVRATIQLNFQLTTADLASPGTIYVAAVNPAPEGGASASASIAVNNPVSTTLSLSPNVVTVGTRRHQRPSRLSEQTFFQRRQYN